MEPIWFAGSTCGNAVALPGLWVRAYSSMANTAGAVELMVARRECPRATRLEPLAAFSDAGVERGERYSDVLRSPITRARFGGRDKAMSAATSTLREAP